MKKISVFRTVTMLLVLLFVSSTTLLAQGTADGYLYVYPDVAEAYPDGSATSRSPSLNALFSQYNVVNYSKSFPGTPSTSFISNAYEIHLDGDISGFYHALVATEMFASIEVVPYYEPASYSGEVHSNVMAQDLTPPCDSVDDPFDYYPPDDSSFNSRWPIEIMELECAWEITKGIQTLS